MYKEYIRLIIGLHSWNIVSVILKDNKKKTYIMNVMLL